MYISLPLEPPSPPCSPPLWLITEHHAGLPGIYFTHDGVYMSMLLSQFIPPSPVGHSRDLILKN